MSSDQPNPEETTPSRRMIPQRPFGASVHPPNPRLPSSVPIVGLGCSSFSTFFWTPEEWQEINQNECTSADAAASLLNKSHPRVQEWIQTIRYAILEAGITLLDTAPWYGHGTSEVVVGWALPELLRDNKIQRNDLTINTKIGRYEADLTRQFDFSAATTMQSVRRSLDRLCCNGYVDVLQLHDPEFAPSLDLLLGETIPAMLECQKRGWCRALGLTGYPLEVQHQILQRSLEEFGRNIWDQSLTYGHYNLHDRSLLQSPISIAGAADDGATACSFANYCRDQNIALLAAAPLSMGLLTHRGPPEWHPASDELKQACARAAEICQQHHVNVSTLALLVALSHPGTIPCTVLGMGTVQEVKANHAVALRFAGLPDGLTSQDEILQRVLSANETKVWNLLRDPVNGPFASLWKNGTYKWDGVEQARNFWRQLNDNNNNTQVVHWQASSNATMR